MEIFSTTYGTLRRYWRGRRYQRLHSSTSNRRKVKIMRLGGGVDSNTRRTWKQKTAQPKLKGKVMVSPVRMLVDFHGGYVDMMIRLGNFMGKLKDKGVVRGKKVAKDKEIARVSCGEEVDTKLVLEIYKRLVASRDLRGFNL